MANTVIAIKKSASASQVPSSLEYGELAINYADGKIFYKNTADVIVEFKPDKDFFGSVNIAGTLIVPDTPSDILTLVAGSNITLTPVTGNDTVIIASTGGSSGYTPPVGITLEYPTGAEKIPLFFTDTAITITEINSVLQGTSTPSVTFSIRHGADLSGSGNEVVTSGITCTNTTYGLVTTSFNDATVDADSWIWLTTSAQSGTVNTLSVTIKSTAT